MRHLVVPSLVIALAPSCGAPSPSMPVAPAAPPPAIAPAAPEPAKPPAASAASPSPPVAPPPPALTVKLVREVEAPIRAIALDAPPHAAALGEDAAFIHDARGWRTTKLPPSVTQDRPARLDIFYGRDDRVRVVGTRAGAGGSTSIYLRWKPEGFISGAREIGRLSRGDGAIVAILGTKDPEIVCRPGGLCIVKRRSGWTMSPAPAEIERVTLGDDVGWGVGGQTFYRLGNGMEPLGQRGTWSRADALFALRDRAYVIETEAAKIHVWEAGEVRIMPSPIPRPRAMWGASASALWLVGDGVAFFDGASWRVANPPGGPFAAALGRGEGDVWIGGKGGLFRVER